MPRQLNEKAARLLEAHASSLGVRLQKNAHTREIGGDERAREVVLEDGPSLPAELVILATGVRSNSYIARLAGLDVNRGIVVNNRLQTSNTDIYAAGDAAEHRGVTYGLWGPSQFQGTIAGMNAAGGEAEFAGIPRSNMLKVLGYDMFSIGQITPEDASYRVFESEKDGGYFFFMFRDSRLVGSMLLGDTVLSSRVKNMVEKGTDCSDILKKIPEAGDIVKRLGDLDR
jgi:nitrite reductase (NADH) large subunit